MRFIDDISQLPEIIEFQGQQMRIIKRSRNVALLQKVSEECIIPYAVGLIFRKYSIRSDGMFNCEEFLYDDTFFTPELSWRFIKLSEARSLYYRLKLKLDY